ncbi:MAG: prepilin-type N-terminal cleavage/methylation domain-containing protein, partial [Bacilli bacterium]|nr:prepilin-type N-terminal cleavage/methylation domain-containing protein [Bacilli bacterium]
KSKKKKQNQQGFTLIELLAVITIMGILMMVAIPSVSRTIENSRRGTFANTAGQYLAAVKQGWIADNIQCYSNTTTLAMASALPNGTYYVPFATVSTKPTNYATSGVMNWSTKVPQASGGQNIETIATANKNELLESGGQSSFGNAHIFGYIEVNKANTGKVTYKIRMVDGAGNGHNAVKTETEANSRSSVTVGSQKAYLAPNGKEKYICKFIN